MDQEKLSSIIMAASSFYYTLTEEQIRRLCRSKSGYHWYIDIDFSGNHIFDCFLHLT